MEDFKKKKRAKKIKLSPLVDRSNLYDTLSFDSDTMPIRIKDEDHSENNSQSISELESL